MLAAREAGVDALLRLGGAHAIAALAYGTETIPRVDKIVGPGNAYVAAAKALVSADCAIDFFAGPSEILDRLDERPAGLDRRRPDRAGGARSGRAGDLRHAEPAAGARGRRRSPTADAGRRPRGEAQSPANGAIVVTRSLDEAIALSERMAPEHVVCDIPGRRRRLTRAGTVFVGAFSAQASGDYVTGSNHVLPTSGAARGRGRPERRRFRARHDRAAADGGGPAHAGAGSDRARAGRRTRSTRGLDCRPTADPTIMSGEYKKTVGWKPTACACT